MVKVIRPDGEEYCCTKSNKRYISFNYHRSITDIKGKKSIWKSSISKQLEFEIFCEADDNNWQDQKGHYFGLRDQGCTPLGNNDERICKFPITSNSSDPWHGYPVGRSNETPPDSFINKWIKDKIITRTIGKSIQRGKL